MTKENSSRPNEERQKSGGDGDVQGSNYEESMEVTEESSSRPNEERWKLSQSSQVRGSILIVMAVDRLFFVIYLVLTIWVTVAITCNYP